MALQVLGGGNASVTALNGREFFTLEATLAKALPGAWVIPEEEPYLPFLRFNDLAAVEVRKLLAGMLSSRLSSRGTLRALAEFYNSLVPIQIMPELTHRSGSAEARKQ